MVALMSDNRLRFFDSDAPAMATRSVAITGLPAGHAVTGFDVLVTGEIYVLALEGTTTRISRVDATSGAVVQQGNILFISTSTNVAFDTVPPDVSNGTWPAILAKDDDSIRRHGLSGSNGAETMFYDNTTSDGDPVDQHVGANPSIVALASTNSTISARTVTLYGIDAATDKLAMVDRVTGRLDTEGPLGAAAGTRAGGLMRFPLPTRCG